MLEHLPASIAFRSNVKDFGATYSAIAASTALWTKLEMSGKSIKFGMRLNSGVQDNST